MSPARSVATTSASQFHFRKVNGFSIVLTFYCRRLVLAQIDASLTTLVTQLVNKPIWKLTMRVENDLPRPQLRM